MTALNGGRDGVKVGFAWIEQEGQYPLLPKGDGKELSVEEDQRALLRAWVWRKTASGGRFRSMGSHEERRRMEEVRCLSMKQGDFIKQHLITQGSRHESCVRAA